MSPSARSGRAGVPGARRDERDERVDRDERVGRDEQVGRDERGSGTLLVVGVMAVVGVVSMMAVIAAVYLVAGHRARGAADLAALSGAAAYAEGRAPCPAAARLARVNDARVTHCDQVGDDVDYVVSVTVEVPVGLRVPGLPPALRGTAHAGPVS